jgi:hypothetical protein
MPRLIDITGNRFGRYTVVRHIQGRKWMCRCDCGVEKAVNSQYLKNGQIVSCGCYKKEGKHLLKHGGCNTPEWHSWQGAKRRCQNEKDAKFADYGGRGIKVCERWQRSFENFLADMGPRPSPDHSLDRIDVNGHYAPGNCRWATRKEQGNNRRNNRRLTANGQTKTLNEWADDLKIDRSALKVRLDRGWAVDVAISTPFKSCKRVSVLLNGERLSLREASHRTGVSINTLKQRLYAGKPIFEKCPIGRPPKKRMAE